MNPSIRMDKVPGLLVGRVLALVLLATVVLAAPANASTSAVSLLGSAEPGPGASTTLTLENGNGLQVIVSVRVQAPARKTIDAATLDSMTVSSAARSGPAFRVHGFYLEARAAKLHDSL